MRVIGTVFRREAAWGCCGEDGLLERGELRRDLDIDEEDTGTVEGAECSELNNERGVMQFAEAAQLGVLAGDESLFLGS